MERCSIKVKQFHVFLSNIRVFLQIDKVGEDIE